MNKNLIKLIYPVTFIFAILLTLGIFTSPVLASGEISFTPGTVKAAPGQEFIVTVRLETGDATVNAISGYIELSPGLSVKNILEGSSVISLWVERPHLIAQKPGDPDSTISFAGIIPGGLYGGRELLRFVAVADSGGTYRIGSANIEALTQGQDPKPLKMKMGTMNVSVMGTATTSKIAINDSLPPTDLTLYLDTYPDIASSDASKLETFAMFSAADKDSGISKYEIAYSYLGKPSSDSWTEVQSPFVIQDKFSNKIVWIRATDHAGNQVYVHKYGPGYYKNIIILAILIGIILCLAHFVRRHISSRQ